MSSLGIGIRKKFNGIERQGAKNDLADLQDMIRQGYSNYDIISERPNFSFSIEKIERVRQIIMVQLTLEKQEALWRNTVMKMFIGLQTMTTLLMGIRGKM